MKKCPYCAEEIREDAVKCKHCIEWLPTASYFYPADKAKSNFRNLFVLKIEGVKVSIECKKDGKIYVHREDEKLKKILTVDSGKTAEIEIAGHKLNIRYERLPFILDMLVWGSSLRISVDGKPLERTWGDPQMGVKIASYALFLFAAISLVGIITFPEPGAKFTATLLLLILTTLGVLSRKIPIFATVIGSLYPIFRNKNE